MKSNIKIFVVVSICIIAGVFFLNSKTSSNSEAKKIIALKSEKLMDQAKNHPGLTKPNLSETENSSDCKSVFESIETLPLKTLIYDLKEERLNLNSECLLKNFPKVKSLIGFPEACKTTKGAEPTTECIEKLFKYKSMRIHNATKNTDIDTLDTAVIIQKFMAIMSDESMNSAEGQLALRTIGQKLYERLPNSETAAKAAALGVVISDKLSEEEHSKINELLDSARSKFPNNWEIYELDLIRRKGQNLESFKNEIVSYYTKFPNSAISQYYMGCLNWSENKATIARDFFKSTTTINPKDIRFSGTYEQSLKTNPPEKVCSVQINFNPDDF